MLHVEVVEWFIEQQVFGVLREHHRDVCALALASRKLVEKAILERRKVHEIDRFRHDSLVFDGEPAARIREAAKSDELTHREASDEVIVLAEDREHRRDLARGHRGDIAPIDRDRARIRLEKAANHGQESRFARAVWAHESGEAARNLDVDGTDLHALPIVFREVLYANHRRPFRRMNSKNASPPMSSMMTVTAPCALKTCRRMK